MMPELLVTDFAGTTLHDAGAVISAFQTALAAYDIPATAEDLAARRGATKRTVFRELAARVYDPPAVEEIAERALARFTESLREAYATGPVEEIPGAGGALARLRDAGVKLALTTGFERGLLDLLLDRLGWGGLFDVTLAGNEVPLGRPAPFLIYRAMLDLQVIDVARVAVVGDTPLDLQAGNHARAGWVIGVLSGAHGIETLGRTPHTHLLPSIAALPELFGLAS